jgi:hypothetical protein
LLEWNSDGQDESMRDFPLTTVLLSVVEMFVFMSILLLLGATPFTAAVMTDFLWTVGDSWEQLNVTRGSSDVDWQVNY